jgi:arylsulfatase A-like enzyme
VTIAFTGDHGIQIHPEQAKLWKFDSGRINQKDTQTAVEKVLDDKFGKPGKGTWIALVNDLNFWISPDALRDRKTPKAEVEAAIKEVLLGVEGAAYVITESEVAARKIPPGIIEKAILNQTFPGRSGDVVIIPKPFWAHKDNWYELGHVTGYNYDRRVPIAIAGPGIKPGRYAQEAQVVDIAPTLSYLLGILPPALSQGRVLSEAVK